MRDPIENINILQKQINELQLENQILKNILDRSGISYTWELKQLKEPKKPESFDPDQGSRIIHPPEITDKMVKVFFTYFWGRHDVYAKRFEKKTGESGYYLQCHNFWQEVCPRKNGQKINCRDCSYRSNKQLGKEDLLAHLRGRSYNASDVIGVYPLFPNGTCRFLVFDFDNHGKEAEKHDYANKDDSWKEEVDSFDVVLIANALHIIPDPEKALQEIDRVLRPGGILIAPTFVEHQTGVGSRFWSGILKLAGIKFEHQWKAQEYLEFLEENGWSVVFSKELSARISMMYAECERLS